MTANIVLCTHKPSLYENVCVWNKLSKTNFYPQKSVNELRYIDTSNRECFNIIILIAKEIVTYMERNDCLMLTDTIIRPRR